MPGGEVLLVGAGPGDPGLLTLAGRDAVASAGVLVYDYLVDPRILAMAPAAAKRIYAGKRAGQHQFPQSEIHRILVRHARRGLKVVRLKGGDPCVFGRGGEEAEACRMARVPFRIIPGVTSGSAVPAYAGMPVTHRGLASAVAFVTGHEDPQKKGSNLSPSWGSLARFPGTLVFFMPMNALSGICRNLVAHGLGPSTPAAAIRWGTLPEQETVAGTLATLPKLAGRLGTPALVVVGKVVGLRRRLAWFERRPLFGRSIGITRAREQASSLEAALSDLGARVVSMPMIRTAPPEDSRPWLRAVKDLAKGRYAWLVLTSPNAAAALREALKTAGMDARALAGMKIAAMGPATAEALGLRPDLMPGISTSAGLAAAFRRLSIRDAGILIPRSDIAPPDLPRALERLGARVDAPVAYRTLPEPLAPGILRGVRLDAVLFSSSSTVQGFAAACRRARVQPPACLVSIGPETSRALRRAGFRVVAEAKQPGVPGLIRALLKSLTPRPGLR